MCIGWNTVICPKLTFFKYAGEAVKDIIDTLVIPAPVGDANEYTVFRDALNAYFLPQINTEYTIYKFCTRAQEQGETLDVCN